MKTRIDIERMDLVDVLSAYQAQQITFTELEVWVIQRLQDAMDRMAIFNEISAAMDEETEEEFRARLFELPAWKRLKADAPTMTLHVEAEETP